MVSPNLDDRTRRILAAIVRDHIDQGAPIGSQAIARLPEVDCSSATVRAVMADLEALGLLEKPHTSAGRIPTAQGYRYYVDALLHVRLPRPEERQLIERRTHQGAPIDALLAETSRLLHELTHHAGVAAMPRPRSERLRRVELLALREGRVLAILVTQTGAVQNRVLTLRPGEFAPSASQLEQAANWLNTVVEGLTLSEARAKLRELAEQDRAAIEEARRHALALGAQAVADASDESALLHIEGQSSFFEDPALAADMAKMRSLFRALEEKQRVLGVLDRALSAEEVSIFIGAESGIAQSDLSVVAAPYRRDGEIVGAVGVIGPTRMDYARVIPLVELTARSLGIALDPDE
jgi:heat-inducible transcriptional repressor